MHSLDCRLFYCNLNIEQGLEVELVIVPLYSSTCDLIMLDWWPFEWRVELFMLNLFSCTSDRLIFLHSPRNAKVFYFEIALLLFIIFVQIIWIEDLNCMGKWLQIIGRLNHTKNIHVLKNEWFYFLTFPEKTFYMTSFLQGVSRVKLLYLPWASLISEYRFV